RRVMLQYRTHPLRQYLDGALPNNMLKPLLRGARASLSPDISGLRGTKMNRLLACTSVIALCAALGAPAAYADDAKQAPTTGASYPATLNAEIDRAKDLRAKGQFADAAKALRQLMLVAGNDPRVAGEYGKTLTQQGYAKDAVDVLSKAVQA